MSWDHREEGGRGSRGGEQEEEGHRSRGPKAPWRRSPRTLEREEVQREKENEEEEEEEEEYVSREKHRTSLTF